MTTKPDTTPKNLTTTRQPQDTDFYAILVKQAGTEDVKKRFEAILQERTPQFIGALVNTVGTTDRLRQSTPESIWRAAMNAAVLDLSCDKTLGQAWIVPYKDNQKNVYLAQFQMGWKGYVQLCLRTGQYVRLNATRVYNGQKVIEDQLTGALRITGEKISEDVIGYAAYMKLTNGFEKAVYWPVEKVKQHMMRYSKSWSRPDSAWKTHFDDMALKTVLMYMVKRWGVMSVTVQKAHEIEAAQEADFPQEPEPVVTKVIDSTLANVPDPTTHESKLEVGQPDPETGEIPLPEESLEDLGAAPQDEPPTDETQASATLTFNPVKVLVEAGVVQNAGNAENLLKHAPAWALKTPEALGTWGRACRGHRDAGLDMNAALAKASGKIAPK